MTDKWILPILTNVLKTMFAPRRYFILFFFLFEINFTTLEGAHWQQNFTTKTVYFGFVTRHLLTSQYSSSGVI